MRELELTWGRILQIWWASLWRNLAYVMLPAAVAGFLFGFVLAINKIPVENHMGKMQLIFALYGLAAGIWITRIILGKTYGGFRIALVAVPASAAETAAAIDTGTPTVGERTD